MKPWNFAIKHPVIIGIMLLTIVLFGGISLTTLKQDLITNISLPQIAVFTIYPGAGPEDVEQSVTDVLEERFAGIQGIDSVESFSQNSLSMIILVFNPEADLDQKINEVRAEINASMVSLPDNISGMPMAVIMSSNMYPIFSVQVESTMNRTVLTDYIQTKVIPLINRVEGISAVDLVGLSERQLDIVIDLEKLESRDISILDIYQLLMYNNLTFPAGSVSYRDKKLNVRTVGNFKTVSDIGEMVVGYKEDERSFVLLKDIADIKIVEKKPDHYAEFGGQSILVLDIMKKSGRKFEYTPEFGIDMQTEHERYLAEEHFKRPVIVRDYPKEIKAFYMRLNDDGRTVAAMDVLVPGIGELIGGSQREERYDVLVQKIHEMGMHEDDYAWYLDSRKYGSVPHAGFGLGFERMMMLVTGIGNIRDVIPFPRTPNSINF